MVFIESRVFTNDTQPRHFWINKNDIALLSNLHISQSNHVQTLNAHIYDVFKVLDKKFPLKGENGGEKTKYKWNINFVLY